VAKRRIKLTPKAAPPSRAAPPPRPALLELRPSTQFRRDVERARKSGKDLAKLEQVIDKLRRQLPLERQYVDHPLKGLGAGFRDCHIEPDWVLIYRRFDLELQLVRTGTHSELFGK
jgi:mRNA interferase YafQ